MRVENLTLLDRWLRDWRIEDMANTKALPKLTKLLLWGVVGVAAVTVGCNWWLLSGRKPEIYSHPTLVPAGDVAIVLGTSPRVGGNKNPFFEERMNCAAK